MLLPAWFRLYMAVLVALVPGYSGFVSGFNKPLVRGSVNAGRTSPSAREAMCRRPSRWPVRGQEQSNPCEIKPPIAEDADCPARERHRAVAPG